MIKKATLIVIILLSICVISNSQLIQKNDSIITTEKARYIKEDLSKFLSSKILYPQEGLQNNIQGDVIISCTINKNGQLGQLEMISSPDNSLSGSSILAMSSLDKDWSPAKINNTPADMKYLMVFRYRIYLDSQPYDYKKQSGKLFEKQKYERALKLYNKGISDNQYDFELFESRSKVREILGDKEGARQDRLKAQNLKNEIMSIVNIYAFGVSRTRVVSTSIERVNYINNK